MRLFSLLLLALFSACDATLPEQVDTPLPDEIATSPILSTGRFVDKGGQSTSGGYSLRRVGQDLYLVLEEDFRTDDGPDLHIVLSPLVVSGAGNTNATEGSLVLAPLMARTGVQVYDLPDTLDWRAYRSVLVHCVRFRHLFGAAPLTARAVGG